VLVALIGLVLVASAGPAAATHSPVQGSGSSGTGWELGPDVDNFCTQNNIVVATQFETTYYEISYTSGSYIVRNHSGSIVAWYSGPVSVRVDHGDMVAYPTHAEPGECVDADGVYGAISLTDATVDGSSGSGSVDCDMTSTNGTYTRTGNDDVTIVFDVSCSVTGNQTGFTGTVSNVLIRHSITATQTPCFEIPGGCSNGDAGSQLTAATYGLSNP
jgi:hypothetical protein